MYLRGVQTYSRYVFYHISGELQPFYWKIYNRHGFSRGDAAGGGSGSRIPSAVRGEVISMKRVLMLAAGVLGGFLGIKYLLPVSMPFVLGAGLALAAEPVVRLLSGRLRLPRAAAAGIGVGALFAAICAALTLLVGLAVRQLRVLAGILPQMELTAREGLNALQSWLLEAAQRTSPGIRSLVQRNVMQLFSGSAELLDEITRRGLSAAGGLLTRLPDSALGIGTTVLAAFLTSAELPRIRQWLRDRLRRPQLQAAMDFLRRLRSTAGQWLVAQLKLLSVTCLVLTAGFLLLGIEYAPLWAMAVSVVDALPILGTGTVLLPWSLVCLVQHSTGRALGLVGLYIATALTRSTLEPRLVGRQLGLDPLVTLIALYAGFRLWGLPGMMLSPLLVITLISMFSQTRPRGN